MQMDHQIANELDGDLMKKNCPNVCFRRVVSRISPSTASEMGGCDSILSI